MTPRRRPWRGWGWVLLGLCACPESPPKLPPLPPLEPIALPPLLDAGAADAGTGLVEQVLPTMVLRVGAGVEVRRAGTDTWKPLSEGEGVHPGDQIRTGSAGNVELSFDLGRMRVSEESEVTLKMLTSRMIVAEVTGHAEGELAPDAGAMTLEAAGLDASATSEGGKVAVTANGRGAGSLAALDGAATIKSKDHEYHLEAGQLVSGRAGKELSRPARIPKKVQATVHWPDRLAVNTKSLSLRVTPSPGSRILVSGVEHLPAEPMPNGDVVIRLTLKHGDQKVVVTAVDPLGRTASTHQIINYDPDAPDISVAPVDYR
jgi:hypothetical protein